MTHDRCLACNYPFNDPRIPQFCFKCGGTFEGFMHLKENGLDPARAHEELHSRPDYHGITLNVAKVLVEVYRTKHDKPH